MEKFYGLDPLKQQTILQAALEEFAENGYEMASTNRIVKRAGIGKGMLFYYFKSKKDLFHHLVSYSFDLIVEEYFNLVDLSEKDFIERFKQASKVKLKAQTENKHVFNFIGMVMLEKELELPHDLQKQFEDLQRRGYALVYEGIDKSLFKQDMDVDKTFNLIRWSIEGYQNELLRKLEGRKMTAVDFDPYWQEFYEYLEILKRSFYR